MRPDKRHDPAQRDPGRRARRFELFYIEQVGSRHHLRFNPFAVALVVCLTVVSVVMIFGLFLFRKGNPLGDVNVNVSTPRPSPYGSNQPVIQPVPVPTLPKVYRPPEPRLTPWQTTPAPNSNAGASPTPSPSPSPTLARTPRPRPSSNQ